MIVLRVKVTDVAGNNRKFMVGPFSSGDEVRVWIPSSFCQLDDRRWGFGSTAEILPLNLVLFQKSGEEMFRAPIVQGSIAMYNLSHPNMVSLLGKRV
jgi:hypothetical protein